MRFEDMPPLSKIYSLDRHLNDEYVQIFKNLLSKAKGAYISLEGDFETYMKIYTGGMTDIDSFMELITGAIEEITDGLYKGEDRDYLYNKLRGFEHCALRHYFSSFWSMFPFGLGAKYSNKSIVEGEGIFVSLAEYRDMQYSLLLYREALSQYKTYVKKLEAELSNYKFLMSKGY